MMQPVLVSHMPGQVWASCTAGGRWEVVLCASLQQRLHMGLLSSCGRLSMGLTRLVMHGWGGIRLLGVITKINTHVSVAGWEVCGLRRSVLMCALPMVWYRVERFGVRG